jgi:hypothetical protein
VTVRRLLKIGIIGAIVSAIARHRRRRMDACDEELGLTRSDGHPEATVGAGEAGNTT